MPPLARFLASLGGGHISDLLISRGTFSTTVVRKIFMATGKFHSIFSFLGVFYRGLYRSTSSWRCHFLKPLSCAYLQNKVLLQFSVVQNACILSSFCKWNVKICYIIFKHSFLSFYHRDVVWRFLKSICIYLVDQNVSMVLTGNILSVPFLIGLSFMDRSQASYAVILVVLFWFIQALNTCSLRVNQIDIAPRYKENIFHSSISTYE